MKKDTKIILLHRNDKRMKYKFVKLPLDFAGYNVAALTEKEFIKGFVVSLFRGKDQRNKVIVIFMGIRASTIIPYILARYFTGYYILTRLGGDPVVAVRAAKKNWKSLRGMIWSLTTFLDILVNKFVLKNINGIITVSMHLCNKLQKDLGQDTPCLSIPQKRDIEGLSSPKEH